jgi:phage-related protein (TIGR01555 family)
VIGVLTEQIAHLDSFINMVTGLGMAAYDKAANMVFRRNGRLTDRYLEGLFMQHPVARKACTAMPEEMVRQWIDIELRAEEDGETSPDDSVEIVTELHHYLRRLNARSVTQDALTWERALGGSALLLVVDDGATDPIQPLNEGNIRTIHRLKMYESMRLQAFSWYTKGPRTGEIETWQLTPVTVSGSGPQIVHETRLIVFPGGVVSEEERISRNGWGLSVLETMESVLADTDQSWSSITNMLAGASQDVWKLKGFSDAMRSSGSGVIDFFKARMQFTQMTMGVNRGITIDKDEEFTRVAQTFTGIHDVMRMKLLRVCQSADTPMMVLYGESPGGLQSSGEGELAVWYDHIAALQPKKLEPPLRRLITLIMLAKDGPTKGKLLEGWNIAFRALRQMSDKEKAEVRFTHAQADDLELKWGVLKPSTVRNSRHRPEGWSAQTRVDPDDYVEDDELEQAGVGKLPPGKMPAPDEDPEDDDEA